MAPVRAIAFDVDCTLIDFVRFKRIASEEAARAMVDAGLDMPHREAERRLEQAYYAHGIDGNTAFTTFLEKEFGKADPRILAAGIQGYLRAKHATLAPYPRTIPTLLGLIRRGYVLGIITDAPREKALQRLAATNLFHFFDAVVTADDNLVGKHTTLPFQQLAKRLGVPLEAMAMVGDNPDRDVRPAREAKMTTVFAAYGALDRPQGGKDGSMADHRIEAIEELLGLFPGPAAAPGAIGGTGRAG
jgi:putative hydrolase of the HAD superfamily